MIRTKLEQDQTVCHFVPKWPGNPYHAELAEHLNENGVHVREEGGLKWIAKESRISGRLPDVIHFHALPRFELGLFDFLRFVMFWIRLFLFQKRGVQIVWTIHDSFHHEARHPQVDRMFSRLLYRKADAIIIHSAAAGRAVERQWDVKADESVFVVPHGNYIGSYLNTISKREARMKFGVPVGKLTFLFLGMIRPYKGVVGLIENFKALSDNCAHLLIAGKPFSDEISAQVSSAAGDHPGIHYWPGNIENDEMQDYLNAADVVVFPYARALTSGALILAMSFSRACIAPRMGALEDTLDEGGGFLYDPADSIGLRKAMKKAIDEAPKLAQMGALNMDRAKGWDWDMVARMTANIYHRSRSKPTDL